MDTKRLLLYAHVESRLLSLGIPNRDLMRSHLGILGGRYLHAVAFQGGRQAGILWSLDAFRDAGDDLYMQFG